MPIRGHFFDDTLTIIMFTYSSFVADQYQSILHILGQFEKIVINSIRIRFDRNWFEKFEKFLVSKFEIRFEGKIIRFVRFENFSIRLIRKSIFNSKNSRKINLKFVRFDSTPPLTWLRVLSHFSFVCDVIGEESSTIM